MGRQRVRGSRCVGCARTVQTNVPSRDLRRGRQTAPSQILKANVHHQVGGFSNPLQVAVFVVALDHILARGACALRGPGVCNQAAGNNVDGFCVFNRHDDSLNKSDECRRAGVVRHRHSESGGGRFVGAEVQNTNSAVGTGRVNQSPPRRNGTGPRGRRKVHVHRAAGGSVLR